MNELFITTNRNHEEEKKLITSHAANKWPLSKNKYFEI